MTGNRKRILYLISGLCAGLAAFAAIELLSAAGLGSYLMLALTQGAVLGLIFGFTFGFSDGLLYKELKSGLIKALIAGGIGALTASAAQLLAAQGMLWSADLLRLEYSRTMELLLPLWRAVGWMLMGAAIGAVDGISRKAPRRAAAGILGGLSGGLAGGLCYEFLLRGLPGSAAAGAAGLALMGLIIGLFLAEFERRFSYGRLRVLSGKLKDREYLLIKRNLNIGGNLRDDISLYGYPRIAGARLSRELGDLCIEPSGDQRVLLNDQKVTSPQQLKYQDVIRLGSIKLLYLPL